MTKIKCFYCPQTIVSYGTSVKCPDCPNSPVYNPWSLDTVFFNAVQIDSKSYRAEYNIKTNITRLFTLNKSAPIPKYLQGNTGHVTITPGTANHNGSTTIAPGNTGKINLTGSLGSPIWNLLAEFSFPLTPHNVESILYKCLKLKPFL